MMSMWFAAPENRNDFDSDEDLGLGMDRRHLISVVEVIVAVEVIVVVEVIVIVEMIVIVEIVIVTF